MVTGVKKKGLDRTIIRLFDDDNCDFSAFFAFPLFLLDICRKKLNIIKIVYFNYFDNGSSLTLKKKRYYLIE